MRKKSERKAHREEKKTERKEKRKERVGYAKLLIFKPVIVAALKKKGARVSMSTKMDKLVPMFKDIVIEHKNVVNYEDYEKPFTNSFEEHLAEADAAEMVVKIVLDFIAKLKEKKDKGEKLTPDEENILNGAEKVADAAKEGAASASKSWFADLWYIWVAVIALLIFVAVKKK